MAMATNEGRRVSITFNNQSVSTQDEDPGRLIKVLRSWGIEYLMDSGIAGLPNKTAKRMPATELVKRLAQCKYPRVRDASISLLLLHPELADAVLEAYQTSEPGIAEQIAVSILASLYLQRLWSFQLTLVLGHTPSFPEEQFLQLWQNRNLPAPKCHQGEAGLIALEEAERRRLGLPLNFIGDWQNQINHLLLQEEAKHHPAVVSIHLPEPWHEKIEEQECSAMSMRHTVTKADIEKFLDALGKSFRNPGRLYLAGGAALVHIGLRPGSTMDIDVAIEASDEDEMVTAIRKLVEKMQINVKFASPGDSIPLHTQWMAQARYVGRYGSIDVFYFDFYSLALSKISRGNDRDLIDVQLLLQQKLITLEELDAAYNEVLPRMGKRPYINLNPQRFAECYALVRQKLQE